MTIRPQNYRLHNGEPAPLAFSHAEYEHRLSGLRKIMSEQNLDAAVLTSMHSIAYYSGFLYCTFGRPYALVVTNKTQQPFQRVLMLGNLGVGDVPTILPIQIGNVTIIGVQS